MKRGEIKIAGVWRDIEGYLIETKKFPVHAAHYTQSFPKPQTSNFKIQNKSKIQNSNIDSWDLGFVLDFEI